MVINAIDIFEKLIDSIETCLFEVTLNLGTNISKSHHVKMLKDILFLFVPKLLRYCKITGFYYGYDNVSIYSLLHDLFE